MSKLKLTTLANQDDSASVPADTIVSGTAKAWVNFNGTGTVAIRRAFNVSSITDNGTGDYTVNFTNALADANYCPVTQSVGETTTSLRGGSMIVGTWAGGATLKSTSQLQIYTGYTFTTGGRIDSAEVNVSIFS